MFIGRKKEFVVLKAQFKSPDKSAILVYICNQLFLETKA